MDMQNLINTAESGLSSIGDNLQRIRELTLQAGNPIMTASDRGFLQAEINQLMQEIDSVSSRTEFNSMRLLDGGFSADDGRGLHTAADAAGRGPTVNIGNFSAGMLLGPDPMDVSGAVFGEAEITAITDRLDNAMARVNRERSYLGAMSNRFDTTIATNQITNLNLAAGRSRIRDADIALEVMRLEQARVLEQTELMAQRRQQEQEQHPLFVLLQP
jgi:flagellin